MLVKLFSVSVLCSVAFASPITFKNGAYDGIVFGISDRVPAMDCKNILNNLEVAIKGASKTLYSTLENRAYWGSVTILLPHNWPDTCAPNSNSVVSSQGETADFNVGPPHPVHGDSIWTQQSRGCGQSGDFVYISHRALLDPKDLSKAMVAEWAKYRYGVFDEMGYSRDPVYPMCYMGDQSGMDFTTGCSDRPLTVVDGICEDRPVAKSKLVHPEAKSSLMFSSGSPAINRFCNATTHNRFAPTKQNAFCNRRSVMEVIKTHYDFTNAALEVAVSNTTPAILYKRDTLTRYVLVVEDTKDMLQRESWSFLRLAIRKWAVHDLPGNTEVGLVSVNETAAHKLHGLSPLHSSGARDLVASNIPYTPGDSRSPACLACGIREAIQMLDERSRTSGPGSSVIVLIAPGTSSYAPEITKEIIRSSDLKIRIATVTYPGMFRQRSLDWIADKTNGAAFTVTEARQNMASSYISTYFKLTNVLYSITEMYYQGSRSDLPMEIHRRELIDDGTSSSTSSVTGSFVLEEGLGEPARFTILTHDIEDPLIRGIKLISPSQKVYSTRSDAMLSLRLMSIPANINETGTWTYTIERFQGSPQSHYVQVMATPWSSRVPVVRAKAWTSGTINPLIIYTEVKRGDYPVLGARVEVTVTRPGSNATSPHRERFELLDTGSGDPDLMRGDGIYSRYFSPETGGPGVYTFEITVTDNGNTAYSWTHDDVASLAAELPLRLESNCCGSQMPTPSVESLSPFQRILPPITKIITSESLATSRNVGKVGDLRVELLASDLKARLSWISPDMGGNSVARYELKYANTVGEITDNFESAQTWSHGTPFPLAPGSETSFTLDLTRDPSLLDQTLFIAIRGFKDLSGDAVPGPVSNWVRVLIPAPPPPPPPPSTFPSAPYDTIYSSEHDSVIPKIARELDFSIEFLLPVVGGILLVTLLISLYCYFCVLRRRKPEKTKPMKNQEKHLNVSVVPSTPQNTANPVTISSPIMNQQLRNDLDSRTLPPQFEPQYIEEDKKRYSMAHYPEDRHMPHHQGNGLSVISGNGTLVRGRTLSPYQSWTASQLLHEHERRVSPYGQIGEEYHHEQYPPPVPPLPAFNHPDSIYGTHPHHQQQQQTVPPPTQYTNNYSRQNSGNLMLFNPSLQGSLSSVSSGDKKKRNVTMV